MYKKWFECFLPCWHHSVAGIIIPVAAPSARVVAVATNGRKPTFWRRSKGFARFEAYGLRIHSVHWSRESNRIVLTAEGSEASRARGFPLTATWVKCGQVLQKRPIITHTIFPVCSVSFDFCNLIVRISASFQKESEIFPCVIMVNKNRRVINLLVARNPFRRRKNR